MQLHLLRHADADTIADRDEDRALSEKGLAQAKKVARFCEQHEIAPPLILSSPVRRAHETALIVSAQLQVELVVVHWLACGMNAEHATHELRDHAALPAVMIVGHEPDFSRLAAHLLGLPSEERILIRKASLTTLDVASFRAGASTLHSSLPCRMM